jgi:hypothetical protein
VGGFRRPCSRRSEVLDILNKELDGDTQIANQQQSFIESESRKYTPQNRGGAGSEQGG